MLVCVIFRRDVYIVGMWGGQLSYQVTGSSFWEFLYKRNVPVAMSVFGWYDAVMILRTSLVSILLQKAAYTSVLGCIYKFVHIWISRLIMHIASLYFIMCINNVCIQTKIVQNDWILLFSLSLLI